MNGLTINHIINKSTYWELSLSGLQIKDHSPTGNTRDTTALTHFGPFVVNEMPYGKYLDSNKRDTGIFDGDTLSYNFPNYDALPGIAYRFRRKEGDLYDNVRVGQYRAKFDLSSQIGTHYFLKTGFEYNYIDLNHKLWMMWNENAYNVYEFNYHRTPSQTGVYVQNEFNFASLVANIGLRFDYYYGGGGKWPTGDPYAQEAFIPQSYAADSVLFNYLKSGRSYIWDAWEKYDSLHPGFLQPIKNHSALSPRIGISFPVTEYSKFYFNYGHFRSNPPYYSMYLYRYRYTKNGLYDMSNPNLEPPRTVSYELGVAANIFHQRQTVLKLSWYSKDVTGQNGEVSYQNSTGAIDYSTWANNEYQDIHGFEINLSKNDNSWLTGWINYNYMLKKTGTTGRKLYKDIPVSDEEAYYADEETRSLPLPKINANLTLKTPHKYNVGSIKNYFLAGWTFTLFGEWQAGEYFTWNQTNALHVNNNMRWPDYYMVDLKIDKRVRFLGTIASFYIDISNLFNFKVSLMPDGYCFERGDGDLEELSDFIKYLASLHLPIYKSSNYADLRAANPGLYIAGHDRVGDLRSVKKPYINDPKYSFWLYEQPRDIWFGIRFNL